MGDVLVVAGVVGAAASLAAAAPARGEAPRRSLRWSAEAARWVRAARWRRPHPPDVAAQVAAAAESLQASVGSGASLLQAIARAGAEVPAPVGRALSVAAGRVELGEDLGASLDGVLREVGGGDVRLLVGALRMHRSVGGPLVEVLEGLAVTLRERSDVAREVAASTAQARLSARVVMMLPYGFLGFLALTSGGAILGHLATPIGATSLVVGIGLQRLAAIWIRRITAPETP